MSRILCIHFPLWPVQRRIATQPELRFRPLVLHARDGSRGERVVVCSPAAHQRGVRPSMPVAEAETLVQHGGGELSAMKHDPTADREALEGLAIWCEQFSPLVGLEETAEPTCLLLDIAGVAMLFGGEERLLVKVTQQLQGRSYHVQLGVGETIGQAWAVAQCGVQSAECGMNLPLPMGEGRGEGEQND